MTSANSPPTGLLPMELPSMRSAEGSRAKTSALQVIAQALPAGALASGLNTRASFAKYDRNACLWKTSQSCLVEGLETFSDRWPRSGTMRNGTAYLRRPLEDYTGEIVFGSQLIPTPTACDHKGSGFPREGRGPANNLRDWFRHHYGFLYPPVNPVEFLMGYPTEHTDLRPSETP